MSTEVPIGKIGRYAAFGVEFAFSPGLSSAFESLRRAILWRKVPILAPFTLLWVPFIVMYQPILFCGYGFVIFIACHIDGHVGSPFALLVIFGRDGIKSFVF